MKPIYAIALLLSLVALPLSAAEKPKKLTCCQEAAAKEKECSHRCCIAAHQKKQSCTRCNPNKEDLAKAEKKTDKAPAKTPVKTVK